MGAILLTMKVDSTKFEDAKKQFEKEHAEAKKFYGENPYSGSWATLDTVKNHTHKEFENLDDAEDYIAEHSEKWEYAIAVTITKDGKPDNIMIGGWCAE